jgi:2-keto-3-deoxy-6-phosphogluconate aldolase
VQEYLESGAICVGLGGVLVNETLIQQGERRKILKISLEIIQQVTKYSS